MTSGKKALLVALGAVLLAAVGLIVYGETRPLKRTFYGSVKDLLPTEAEVPGWKVEYLPISDTPEMQAKVNELLNYDDAVYAVYTRGTERISIYIAYWTPGKMSERLIAGHTPDVCWVGAGWRIVDAGKVGSGLSTMDGEPSTGYRSPSTESRRLYTAAPVARVFPALKSQVSGFDIDAGEWRLMERGSNSEEVAFWHLSGTELISYGVGKPRWQAAATEATEAFGQRGEQFFIRLSSSAKTSGRAPLTGRSDRVERGQ